MEFAEGGSLKKYIYSNQKRCSETVRFYAAQVLDGLLYLHQQQNVIYRDLKPENILLTREGHVKLCDFGLSKFGKLGMSFCGTPEYIAPEIINSKLNKVMFILIVSTFGPMDAFYMKCLLESFLSKIKMKNHQKIILIEYIKER